MAECEYQQKSHSHMLIRELMWLSLENFSRTQLITLLSPRTTNWGKRLVNKPSGGRRTRLDDGNWDENPKIRKANKERDRERERENGHKFVWPLLEEETFLFLHWRSTFSEKLRTWFASNKISISHPGKSPVRVSEESLQSGESCAIFLFGTV